MLGINVIERNDGSQKSSVLVASTAPQVTCETGSYATITARDLSRNVVLSPNCPKMREIHTWARNREEYRPRPAPASPFGRFASENVFPQSSLAANLTISDSPSGPGAVNNPHRRRSQ